MILLVLGLFPKVGARRRRDPPPVLGGAGLALFGTVAASGIRSLSAVHYEGNDNIVIVALSIGMGIIPIAVPTFYEHFPSWFQTIFDSGISSAAVTAVLLNMLFNVGRREPAEAASSRTSRRLPGSRRTTTCRAGRPRRAVDRHHPCTERGQMAGSAGRTRPSCCLAAHERAHPRVRPLTRVACHRMLAQRKSNSA